MLTERQIQVLKVIIDEFIQSAQPIGSRAIAKKDGITASPATIRNEMADLEELGFLVKTHTSSGRVPSEKGYRFYVDHLLIPFQLSSQDMGVIQHTFAREMLEFEKVVQQSAKVLSDLTSYTSIVLGPQVFETTLKKIQIVGLSDHSAVAILVTSSGHVEHRYFNVPKMLKSSDLEKLVNILNDRLVGVPIIQLEQKLSGEIAGILQEHMSNLDKTYAFLQQALLEEQPAKLYMDGKTNMMRQPEFNDIQKIQSLFSIMEQEDEIAKLLKTSDKGIKVFIGHENQIREMQDCSLITASYSLGDKQLGTIALLGPTRMEYSKVISVLNALSVQLSRTFDSWY
ncbi:heat-inducible transcriptional repressor HrcA [Gracilibacillus alcaliphilus]|uniref:heat-inducible transcriptional repressor HrcA n=1 Tax=Gracilibacillus alcaliphilus TaxID=1401441 RepID=UPI0019570AEF|nr:heat-inducible transcriptional repressor HrcA [Gracilibacillus alcaliphilus]MBM7678886.1 heat-inducible transcriptional repressor [Gracilibacillus alcaliphilus]